MQPVDLKSVSFSTVFILFLGADPWKITGFEKKRNTRRNQKVSIQSFISQQQSFPGKMKICQMRLCGFLNSQKTLKFELKSFNTWMFFELYSALRLTLDGLLVFKLFHFICISFIFIPNFIKASWSPEGNSFLFVEFIERQGFNVWCDFSKSDPRKSGTLLHARSVDFGEVSVSWRISGFRL